MKKALITGCAGQAGSYLSEFLLDKGYRVYGLVRRTSTSESLWRLKKSLQNEKFSLIQGDVTDYSSLLNIVSKFKPDEIYNLAAQSHVGSSFEQPFYTTDATYIGCLNLLEVVRFLQEDSLYDFEPGVYRPKVYQASSSEMFGDSFTAKVDCPTIEEYDMDPATSFYLRKYQDENTKFNPQSPYAIAKLAAHHAVNLYRKAYGIYAVSGILFNHESPRRGELFVTRKITKYIGELIKSMNSQEDCYFDSNITPGYISMVRLNSNNVPYGHTDSWLFGPKFPKLKLGNLDAKRDWGFAGDYVEGMWLMLQQDHPQDFVIGTGETHTVKEFAELAFSSVGLNFEDCVETDQSLMRPSEVPYLCAKPDKANRELNWSPKTSFPALVQLMVEADCG
jgi:GDPmannose 4,6-dehydratase